MKRRRLDLPTRTHSTRYCTVHLVAFDALARLILPSVCRQLSSPQPCSRNTKRKAHLGNSCFVRRGNNLLIKAHPACSSLCFLFRLSCCLFASIKDVSSCLSKHVRSHYPLRLLLCRCLSSHGIFVRHDMNQRLIIPCQYPVVADPSTITPDHH